MPHSYSFAGSSSVVVKNYYYFYSTLIIIIVSYVWRFLGTGSGTSGRLFFSFVVAFVAAIVISNRQQRCFKNRLFPVLAAMNLFLNWLFLCLKYFCVYAKTGTGTNGHLYLSSSFLSCSETLRPSSFAINVVVVVIVMVFLLSKFANLWVRVLLSKRAKIRQNESRDNIPLPHIDVKIILRRFV